jgi:hypothetical protein
LGAFIGGSPNGTNKYVCTGLTLWIESTLGLPRADDDSAATPYVTLLGMRVDTILT